MDSEKAYEGCLHEGHFLDTWASPKAYFHLPLRMKLMIRWRTPSTMIRTLARGTQVHPPNKLIFGPNLKRPAQTGKKSRKKCR